MTLTMKLVPLASHCIDELYCFESDNAAYFEQWVPPRPIAYQSASTLIELVDQQIGEINNGANYQMYLAYCGCELIGRFNLTNITTQKAEVGYRIGAGFTGRGYASAGLRLLFANAKSQQLTELEAYTTADNVGSQCVLTKVGFSHKDTQVAAAELNGKLVDLLRFSCHLDTSRA